GCRAPVGAMASLSIGDSGLEAASLRVLAGFARPDGSLAATIRASGRPDEPDLADRVLAELASSATDAALAKSWPRILVTRAREQAPALALALVDRGLAPLLVPAIAIEPAEDGLGPAIQRLSEFDWVVVTSANAARAIRAAAD